jgi:hypothetical protein
MQWVRRPRRTPDHNGRGTTIVYCLCTARSITFITNADRLLAWLRKTRFPNRHVSSLSMPSRHARLVIRIAYLMLLCRRSHSRCKAEFKELVGLLDSSSVPTVARSVYDKWLLGGRNAGWADRPASLPAPDKPDYHVLIGRPMDGGTVSQAPQGGKPTRGLRAEAKWATAIRSRVSLRGMGRRSGPHPFADFRSRFKALAQFSAGPHFGADLIYMPHSALA